MINFVTCKAFYGYKCEWDFIIYNDNEANNNDEIIQKGI